MPHTHQRRCKVIKRVRLQKSSLSRRYTSSARGDKNNVGQLHCAAARPDVAVYVNCRERERTGSVQLGSRSKDIIGIILCNNKPVKHCFVWCLVV